MVVINVSSGKEVEELNCAEDGEVIQGPRCSYCSNTKWKVRKAKNAQYCTNMNCGRSIPLQDGSPHQSNGWQCQLQVQEYEQK